MKFKKNQSIYLQIEDLVCEHIITGKWAVGYKISSVRELAANIEVNPNTVMRAYTHLQEAGIISNKRGIGYFVSDGAPEKVLEMHRKEFIQEELPEIFKKMRLLNMGLEEFEKLYNQHQ